MKLKVNQRKSGVILSYLNLAISSIIPFIYTPIMLRLLGQNNYGLYQLAYSITGYLSLFKLGIGGSVVRYLNKSIAKGDKESEGKMMGAFIKIFLVCSSFVIIGGILLTIFAAPIFSHSKGYGLTSSEVSTLRILIVILTADIAISFPMSVLDSTIIANQRFVFSKLIGMIETVLGPCICIVMLLCGGGVISLTVETIIMVVIAFICNYIYVKKKLHLKPIYTGTPKGLVKEILSFSTYILIASLVDLLYWSTDKILIGSMMGTAAVAVYYMGSQFNSIVTNLSTQVQAVFAPQINIMYYKGNDTNAMSEIFIKLGRIQYIILSLIVPGFIVFGKQFLILWAGKDYTTSYYVALLVMLPLCIPLIENTGISICVAKGRHKFRAVSYFVIAVFNVVGTYLMLKFTNLGVIGAAIPTAIAYLVGQGFVMNWYYKNKIGLNINKFWKEIFKMMPVTILMLALGITTSHFVDFSKNIFMLIIGVLGYVVVFVPLTWCFVMNDYEKLIFKKPVLKVIGKLKGRKGNILSNEEEGK